MLFVIEITFPFRIKNAFSLLTYNGVGGICVFNFSDSFFNKVEKKTNVGKETILELAKKLQENDLKNETTLREVIQEIGQMTGKTVSKEKEDKIVSAVVNDQVPKDLDKML